MTRWGMTIDMDLCTGCGACQVACAQENNVALGEPGRADEHLIRWLELLPFESGEYPETQSELLPSPCQMCDRPACVTVCPVYATYKNAEGVVPQIYHQCIGCRYCVNACPYTCKYYNWEDPVWPTPMARGHNPNVSLRTRGVTEKCNFCSHRIEIARVAARAEERELGPEEVKTACQEVCPVGAIRFGDLDHPDSEVRAGARSPRATRLLEDLDMEPKVNYLRKRS